MATVMLGYGRELDDATPKALYGEKVTLGVALKGSLVCCRKVGVPFDEEEYAVCPDGAHYNILHKSEMVPDERTVFWFPAHNGKNLL
jgi:hypothetical protein